MKRPRGARVAYFDPAQPFGVGDAEPSGAINRTGRRAQPYKARRSSHGAGIRGAHWSFNDYAAREMFGNLRSSDGVPGREHFIAPVSGPKNTTFPSRPLAFAASRTFGTERQPLPLPIALVKNGDRYRQNIPA